MAYYPAMLDLEDRLVLVVGGGRVAARKVASLLEAGARVRLVSPELAPESAELVADPRVEYRRGVFVPADLEGVALVISATGDRAVNRQVADRAGERGLFVNVVDVPELCSFIVPAVVRRGDLLLAVSTGGASPAVARRLRRELEAAYGPSWEPYLRLMAALRRAIMARGRPAEENRPLFRALADSELGERVAAGDGPGVDRTLQSVLGPGWSLARLGWGPRDLRPRGEQR